MTKYRPGPRSGKRTPCTSGVTGTVVVATSLGTVVGIAAALILAALLFPYASRRPPYQR